jgi:hypothetical protein
LALAIKLIAPPVMIECREKARIATERPTNWSAAAVIVGVWLAAVALLTYVFVEVLDLTY